MMLTPADYRADKLYPRVARAMADLLKSNSPVSAPAVFVKMGMLSEENLQAWRGGKVPYLERVITGSLGKTNRVVRLISLYEPPIPASIAGDVVGAYPGRVPKTDEERVQKSAGGT
jgi:hypothetical protein